MSSLLHLATTEDEDRLLPMIAAYHELEGIESTEARNIGAVRPLLEGSPHGAIWFVGPKMAPVGYIAVSFGWSIELGGMDGFVDEFWIREKVRGRGMGGEAMHVLIGTLKAAGVKALHLEVNPENTRASRLYTRAGFRKRPFNLMTWTAAP